LNTQNRSAVCAIADES